MAAHVWHPPAPQVLRTKVTSPAEAKTYRKGVDFQVHHYESGQARDDLPIFTAAAGTVDFSGGGDAGARPAVGRQDVPDVFPGLFYLTSVLSPAECDQIIALTEAMGYTSDAPVSLGRDVRQNESCVWIADAAVTEAIFERCRALLPPTVGGGEACGLNGRFRLYKYGPGDVFKPHTDGSWPGSAVVGDQYHHDAFGDRWSQLTFVLYLNDNFTGGETTFYNEVAGQARGMTGMYEPKSVAPQQGAACCFFHGNHELSPLHEGSRIQEGTKYIIRSDVLYKLPKVDCCL